MKKYLTISNGRDGSLVGHKIWLASEDPFVDALPETISFSPHTMLKTITATLTLASAIASPIDTSSIKPITNFLDGLVEATPCKLPILKTIFTICILNLNH